MIVHTCEQRSPEWYALRAGIPTASEFSKIITSKGERSKSAGPYAMTLAAELYAGKPVDAWNGNAYTQRGRELEPAALTLYEFVNDVTVDRVGFVTDDDRTMGCSPDGLVGDDGMVEVKCLKAEYHIEAILYHRTHRRCPAGFVQQTQGQLMIGERRWCDLLFYHPELPPLIIRQQADAFLARCLRQEIKTLLQERDAVLDVLRAQASASSAAPSPSLPAARVDINDVAPIF